MHIMRFYSDLHNMPCPTPLNTSDIVHASDFCKTYAKHRKQSNCSPAGQAATACEEIVKHIDTILEKVCCSFLLP
jgi:hypothetical protein